MIVDFTPQEKALRDEAFTKWTEADERTNETAIAAIDDPELREKLVAEHDDAYADYCQRLTDIQNHAEQRVLDSMQGNVVAIVKEAKRQVDLIITQHINAVGYVGDIETRIFPNGVVAQEKRKGVDALNYNTRFVNGYPAIHKRYARHLICTGIKILTDYLHENTPEEEKALNSYIDAYLHDSPYVLEPQKKTTKLPVLIAKTYGMMNDKTTISLESLADYTIIYEDNATVTLARGIDQLPSLKETDPKKRIVDKVTVRRPTFLPESNLPVGALYGPVYDSISTAYHNHKQSQRPGPLIISPREIWRIMNGLQGTKMNPSENQIKQICAAVDIMSHTDILVDMSDSISRFDLKIDDERITSLGKFEPLLNAKPGIAVTVKGNEVPVYYIEKEPLMMTINRSKDHIVFVPTALLDTTSKTGNEGYTPFIREYLLRRIFLSYNNPQFQPRIKFDTMYTATGIQPPVQRLKRENFGSDASYKSKVLQEAAKDRKKVTELLDAWIEMKLIRDYTLTREGRRITGVDITLYKGKPPALVKENDKK